MEKRKKEPKKRSEIPQSILAKDEKKRPVLNLLDVLDLRENKIKRHVLLPNRRYDDRASNKKQSDPNWINEHERVLALEAIDYIQYISSSTSKKIDPKVKRRAKKALETLENIDAITIFIFPIFTFHLLQE